MTVTCYNFMKYLNVLTVDDNSKLVVRVHEIEKILKMLNCHIIHYNLGMDDFMGFTGYTKNGIVIRLTISVIK